MKLLITGLLTSSLLVSSLSTSVAMTTSVEPSVVDLVELTDAPLAYSHTLSSGTCGDNAFWSFDGNSGTLTISGSGAMTDYPNYAPPWAPYRSEIKTVVVESGITTIGWSAFHSCKVLTSVHLPETLRSLEYGAFAFCTSLKSIHLPSSLQVIGIGAFVSCTSLTSLIVPIATTTIKDSAFVDCTALGTLTFPSSLKSIESSAFRRCNALSTVYHQGSSRSGMSIKSSNNGTLTGAKWIYNSYTASVAPALPEPVAPPSFPDWAMTYVDFVGGHIMPDLSTSNYDDKATRGLIAQCLYNMYGNGNSGLSHPFTDEGYHSSALGWCHQNGIMSGTGDNYFGTHDPITREQVTLIFLKLAQHLGYDTTGETDSVLDGYEDTAQISSWASHGMAWAVGQKLMTGNENKLNPQGQISRVETSVMLYHFAQLSS